MTRMDLLVKRVRVQVSWDVTIFFRTSICLIILKTIKKNSGGRVSSVGKCR